MTRTIGSTLARFALATSLALGAACATEVVGDEELEPELEEAESGGVIEGGLLFNAATFGGNGRRCATCHPTLFGQSGTLNPAQVQLRFKLAPGAALFLHDGADVIGGNTFNRIKTHATILIVKALPPNVSLAGSSARTVTLARGIPTVMNTPALDPVLMYDGREPTLQQQALNAALGHAQSNPPTSSQLDAIAAFQQTLFNRSNLKNFVQQGTPLALPLGTTESEIRGRRFFIADGETDPDMAGEGPGQACGWCHSGDMLNSTSAFFGTNITGPFGFPFPEGFRFFRILVSERNLIGNPVQSFQFTNPDGSVATVNSADPGLALVNGNAGQAGFFKIPTVWGSKDTAPYFHDNSANNFTELMDHYQFFFQNFPPTFGLSLSAQDKADIIAYMNLL